MSQKRNKIVLHVRKEMNIFVRKITGECEVSA